MKKLSRAVKTAIVGCLAGSMMFQAGSCTTQAVKTQLSRGLATSLNGMLNIVVTDLANEVFDVDD